MLESLLMIASIVSTGLMGGVYFTFSVFVMRSLADLDTNSATQCMNSINRVILKTAFIPVFFISSLLLPVLAIIDSRWMIVTAAAVYLVGMLACTVFFNVPLNNALRDAKEPDLEVTWTHYLKVWTTWNHVRTAGSLIACGLLSMAAQTA